ncbi:MAG TPA: HAD-IA family hydrolase [Anaerolineales bacterium]
MIRGLIFDFDGLILETEGPIYQSWNEFYQAHNCQLSFEVWAGAIGKEEAAYDPLGELEARIGRRLPPEIVAARRRRETELIAVQATRPGVRAYLESARRLGLKTGLASSSSCAWVVGHLNRLGLLGYFDCLRAADDVQKTKPDPDLYLAALEGLGLAASEAVAFEDSPNGILAAKRAGLLCVAVPHELTRRLSLDRADYRLDSLADLPLADLLSILEE